MYLFTDMQWGWWCVGRLGFLCCSQSRWWELSVYAIFALLSPILLVWMITLFRLSGSTAEYLFFTLVGNVFHQVGPSTTFAGVTLLALGNGAAAVSATMSAIVNDDENGYKLSLGALTGAVMLVGGVVAGIVVLVEDGVPCRGALVRDVTALAVTIGIVWSNLSAGVIGTGSICLFLSLYAYFVLTVLVADVYHRAVVLPRLAAAAATADTDGVSSLPLVSHPNLFMRYITAFSNYDNPCQNDTTIPATDNVSIELAAPPPTADGNMAQPMSSPFTIPLSNESGGVTTMDQPMILHGLHGTLHGDEQVPPEVVESTSAPRLGVAASSIESMNGTGSVAGGATHGPPTSGSGAVGPEWNDPMETVTNGGVYTLVEDHMDNLCVGNGATSGSIGPDGTSSAPIGVPASKWKGALHDGKQEVKTSMNKLWANIAFNGDLMIYERVLLLFELPFTFLQMLSIPIPCEGYFNQGLVALSIAFSPLWFLWYMLGHEVYLLSRDSFGYFMIYWGVAICIGALVLRFAPGGNGVMTIVV